MQNQSTRLCILRAIDRHPAVCAMMQRMSDAMLHLMNAVAMDTSLGGFDGFEHAAGDDDPCFKPHMYHQVLASLLRLATTRNIENSGCIMQQHVLEALTGGNLRERCSLFMNLMFKEPRGIVFTWILQRSGLYRMGCLNATVVAAYKARIAQAPALSTSVFRQAFMLRTVQHKRSPREQDTYNARRLPQHQAVPPLSQREMFMHKDWFPTRQGYTAWKTGRMQWKITDLGADLTCAARNGNEIVCGTSGHTDAMLAFSKVLACYDLRIMTLVCIVWLVGCDHHSMCEVLLAARAHGLSYNFENAEAYTMALLQSLD